MYSNSSTGQHFESFSINNITGVITLTGNLDREEKSLFKVFKHLFISIIPPYNKKLHYQTRILKKIETWTWNKKENILSMYKVKMINDTWYMIKVKRNEIKHHWVYKMINLNEILL